ncbi:Arabinanase/levansucrase/invertase [Aspergillus aculeatinus CBS 121060]|uniref:Arabinanase/levansucrase/invertase n=1 Tax=Aspergillus aculeatinus CBS 121060 TaxID=1448322 RepID=A0ACD1H0V7_9EURO|nr:Arabinanase/levansucrase/invertase [Aspergillus aculeatinus CBS 121060]RAH67230.1 Arabinanase/levansucrase/invertase [Aspergillus aculeatinus CBS 121060]
MRPPLPFPLISLSLLLTPFPTHATGTTPQTPLEQDQVIKTGNPLPLPGPWPWYADPEAHLFPHTGPATQPQTQPQQNYWIYPTYSAAYEQQTFFDAFSSPDLITWTKHPTVLNITQIPWSTNRAAWAPSVARRPIPANKRSNPPSAPANTPPPAEPTPEDETEYEYYMYFSTGDGTGIGVAKSTTNSPAGPFADALGKPLVNGTVMGAEAIDAQVFVDYPASQNSGGGGTGGDGDGDNGSDTTPRVWLYFGGWGHAVVGELDAESMTALKGGFVEITPPDYVEGPWVLKRRGVYYFMYSVGGWGDNSYGVSYVTGPSPTGPFSSTPTKILQGNDKIGTSTGHHSVLTIGEEYYIVYHRRYPNDTARDHRVVCIDRMEFDAQGNILPVNITLEGVDARPL